MSFVKDLECSRCGQTGPTGVLQNVCPKCQSPWLVRYHLRQIKRQVKKTSLLDRPADMWRYMEVMPVDYDDDIVSLGEGYTPLLPLSRLGKACGLAALYLKDEALNPTGTFKARGLAAAVSMARKLGARRLVIPSAGNAGGALAAYGAKAGLETFVFMPLDTPLANVAECRVAGAHVELVPGVITDAARLVAERREQEQWFDVSTLREPYRVEGKKTMAYEIAEQLRWRVPDAIVCPTGGATGLIGMWKAFQEMEELGWIGAKRPRMVAVQAEGCAPIVRAFHEGRASAEPWPHPQTFASGVRVPRALGDFLALKALRESHGWAMAVSDREMYDAIHEVGATEGLFLCPEGAACWAAVKHLRKNGWIEDGETVVILNTGTGVKYLDSLRRFEEEQADLPNRLCDLPL